MLSTILTVAAGLSLLVSLTFSAAAVFYSRKSRTAVSEVALWINENNKRSVTLKQLAELSAEVTELKDSYDSLLTAHKKLRSRIGMRELRQKRNEVDNNDATELGSVTDKNELRLKAKARGLL